MGLLHPMDKFKNAGMCRIDNCFKPAVNGSHCAEHQPSLWGDRGAYKLSPEEIAVREKFDPDWHPPAVLPDVRCLVAVAKEVADELTKDGLMPGRKRYAGHLVELGEKLQKAISG